MMWWQKYRGIGGAVASTLVMFATSLSVAANIKPPAHMTVPTTSGGSITARQQKMREAIELMQNRASEFYDLALADEHEKTVALGQKVLKGYIKPSAFDIEHGLDQSELQYYCELAFYYASQVGQSMYYTHEEAEVVPYAEMVIDLGGYAHRYNFTGEDFYDGDVLYFYNLLALMEYEDGNEKKAESRLKAALNYAAEAKPVYGDKADFKWRLGELQYTASYVYSQKDEADPELSEKFVREAADNLLDGISSSLDEREDLATLSYAMEESVLSQYYDAAAFRETLTRYKKKLDAVRSPALDELRDYVVALERTWCDLYAPLSKTIDAYKEATEAVKGTSGSLRLLDRLACLQLWSGNRGDAENTLAELKGFAAQPARLSKAEQARTRKLVAKLEAEFNLEDRNRDKAVAALRVAAERTATGPHLLKDDVLNRLDALTKLRNLLPEEEATAIYGQLSESFKDLVRAGVPEAEIEDAEQIARICNAHRFGWFWFDDESELLPPYEFSPDASKRPLHILYRDVEVAWLQGNPIAAEDAMDELLKRGISSHSLETYVWVITWNYHN